MNAHPTAIPIAAPGAVPIRRCLGMVQAAPLDSGSGRLHATNNERTTAIAVLTE
jgi:hypothetical protein